MESIADYQLKDGQLAFVCQSCGHTFLITPSADSQKRKEQEEKLRRKMYQHELFHCPSGPLLEPALVVLPSSES